MEEASNSSYLWDRNARPASSERPTDPLATGLPAAWWTYVWGFAGIVFSAFWLAESWQASGRLLGATRIDHLTRDLWCLLLTLACCVAILQFWKRRSGTFGIVLCIAVAAAAMAGHKL